eukprot:CAMPEP_0194780944 /NCGR_PEP_ID=MMETSP0323_2-20130528/74911_1 /TAXON_ID=2866 ORGANISM="Crypthecodinium cohnii, Strain Seligo" /NCGR_SAMPLE_ID=MMETSP0323_2 /ASSEMBLY_ACC=CAM_ASM_000346 /LENGTH=92 /DNA_ID=CAMNT_0039719121 /DNA_START=512 /DNA_END=790 /DNA_ORIENTATION=+
MAASSNICRSSTSFCSSAFVSLTSAVVVAADDGCGNRTRNSLCMKFKFTENVSPAFFSTCGLLWDKERSIRLIVSTSKPVKAPSVSGVQSPD